MWIFLLIIRQQNISERQRKTNSDVINHNSEINQITIVNEQRKFEKGA